MTDPTTDDLRAEADHWKRVTGDHPVPKVLRWAADRIDALEAERAHSLGCDHSVDPPHRCLHETCYRQGLADRIEELAADNAALRRDIGLLNAELADREAAIHQQDATIAELEAECRDLANELAEWVTTQPDEQEG